MQKKEKVELGITAVMALILIVMVSSMVVNAKKPSVKEASPQGAEIPLKSLAAGAEVPAGRLRIRKKVNEDRFFDRFTQATAVLPLERDPFAKGNSGPKDPRAGLVLEGVMWDDVKPMVIINQQFLSVGDLTGPFKVIKISKDKVTLQDAQSQFDLLLNQNK